jgi:hypothetical protein
VAEALEADSTFTIGSIIIQETRLRFDEMGTTEIGLGESVTSTAEILVPCMAGASLALL